VTVCLYIQLVHISDELKQKEVQKLGDWIAVHIFGSDWGILRVELLATVSKPYSQLLVITVSDSTNNLIAGRAQSFQKGVVISV